MLEYYTRHFDTVELNNSFYKLPNRETLEQWKATVPESFLFAVKASRFITHNKKLKDPRPSIDLLMSRIEVLGKKLGPILFQLPPRWKKNTERLSEFIQLLPKGQHYTFELREESWMDKDVYEILSKANAAFCIYDLGGYQSPKVLTANWAYIRLHGPSEEKYNGGYSTKALKAWAKQIREWRDLKDVYIYFDNDIGGNAPYDALQLKKLIQK